MEFILSADSSSVSMDPSQFDAKIHEAQRRIDAKEAGSQKNSAQSSDLAQVSPSTEEITTVLPVEYLNAEATSTFNSDIRIQHQSTEVIIETVVVKGSLGIGLDLSSTADGRAVIRRLKAMPPGVVNPATLCHPPTMPGDIIIAVNNSPYSTLSDTVAAIKSSGEEVKLKLLRINK